MTEPTIPAPAGAARQDAIIAYAAPFAAFLIFTSLEGLDALKDFYHFVYPLKLAVVVGLLVHFRRYYPAVSSRGWPLGVAVGAVGVVAWVALASVDVTAWIPEGVRGCLVGSRLGWNPWESSLPPAGRMAMIAARLLGLAVVVPIMEELFWRGFLIRFLVRENFQEVPFGAFTPLSFAVVTVFFIAVHPELLAALVWGMAVNGLFYASKNLWACVLAHAVTNGLLGAYILQNGVWGLW